jgi:hypothetical protein
MEIDDPMDVEKVLDAMEAAQPHDLIDCHLFLVRLVCIENVNLLEQCRFFLTALVWYRNIPLLPFRSRFG